MDLRIDDLASRIITVDTNDTLNNARDIMLKKNISRIVVVRNSDPVGIITEKRIGSFLYNNVERSLDEIKNFEVMKSPLFLIKNDKNIQECAKIMLEKKISSLFVVDNRKTIQGIITKSDLVRRYSEECQGINFISDYMTKKIHTVLPSHSLHKVISIMLRNRISRVIVSRDNKPVGIITSRDLMPITSFVEDEEKLISTGLEGIGNIMLARDVMKKPFTINENQDLANAANTMNEKRISGIPIVNKALNLLGIITKTDIVRALSELKS